VIPLRRLILSSAAISAAVVILIVVGLPQRADYTGVLTIPGVRPTAPEINAYAPPFALPTLMGELLQLESLRGETVLINFWATWCVPCAIEMPELQTLYEQRDVRIIAVNLGESREEVAAWVEAFGLTFDVVLDARQEVAALYALRGQPSTYVVSPDGIITAIFYGAVKMNTLSPYLNG
jgi:peroxiredoxin